VTKLAGGRLAPAAQLGGRPPRVIAVAGWRM